MSELKSAHPITDNLPEQCWEKKCTAYCKDKQAKYWGLQENTTALGKGGYKQKGKMVEIPTQNDCTEGDHLFVLAIIVESQVPQTHIQVLNKHSLVLDQGLDAAALPRGLHHTPLLFAIQTLHEIILQGGKTKRGKKKRTQTNKPQNKQTWI